MKGKTMRIKHFLVVLLVLIVSVVLVTFITYSTSEESLLYNIIVNSISTTGVMYLMYKLRINSEKDLHKDMLSDGLSEEDIAIIKEYTK